MDSPCNISCREPPKGTLFVPNGSYFVALIKRIDFLHIYYILSAMGLRALYMSGCFYYSCVHSSKKGKSSISSASEHIERQGRAFSALMISGIFLLYAENVFKLSISSRRALLILTNSSSCSIPRYLRPSKLAAMPVVLLPANGSSIHAPAFVDAIIMRESNPRGFCVGCFVHDFSQGAIAGSRQTSVICLSSLICLINS